ncbi:hypothetical protein, partial [Methanocalculus sp.]
TFSHIDLMDAEHHLPLMSILNALLKEGASPAFIQTTKRIIKGNPVAKRSYVDAFGQIPGLE